MKTLFLQAPSYDGFDGGAGSRYQARREVRSFWYPTWLAQPAALVPGSRLLDAPPKGCRSRRRSPVAQTTISSSSTRAPVIPDRRAGAALKERKPRCMIGMVGAKVAVDPPKTPWPRRAIDFVCREEFDFTCKDVAEGKPLARSSG